MRRLRRRARNLTVREIKMAICTHEKRAQFGPSEYRAAWGGWRTTVTCPSCGFCYSHETSGTPHSGAQDHETERRVVPLRG